MATGVQLFHCIGVFLRRQAVGVDGPFYAVSVEGIHDTPYAGSAAVFAIGQRRVIRFVAAAPVLAKFRKRFEGHKKAHSDFGILGPFDGCGAHNSSMVLPYRTSSGTAHSSC